MGGPGVESLAPGGVPQPPAPQPLTPSGRETLAPINARVFSCALSKRKWASWRLHKTGSRSTARRTTVPISSNSGRPKAMRLRSQAKAEQLAPSSHPGRPGASPSWGVAQPDRAALHHMQLVRTCARRLQLVATRPLAGLDTRAAAPFLIRRRNRSICQSF